MHCPRTQRSAYMEGQTSGPAISSRNTSPLSHCAPLVNIWIVSKMWIIIYEPRHEISNNVVYVTSKASDQPARMRSLIRSLCLSLEYMSVKLLTEYHLEFLNLKGGWTGSSESAFVKMPHCWQSHVTAHMKKLLEWLSMWAFRLLSISNACSFTLLSHVKAR